MAINALINRREQQLVSMRKLIAVCIRTEVFPKPTVFGSLSGICILEPAPKSLALWYN